MKEMLKILLLAAIILPACSASKFTQTDSKYLQNHWIHSFEEDTKEERVYRSSDYIFKPSRGREGFILKTGGELKITPISPNDKPVTYTGTWKMEGTNLALNYEDKKEVYTILEISSDKLKLK